MVHLLLGKRLALGSQLALIISLHLCRDLLHLQLAGGALVGRSGNTLARLGLKIACRDKRALSGLTWGSGRLGLFLLFRLLFFASFKFSFFLFRALSSLQLASFLLGHSFLVHSNCGC